MEAGMTDTISVERRSALMGRIRGAGNESTEVALAKILRQEGLSGWRRQQHIDWALASLPLRLQANQQRHRFRATVAPDFVFRQQRIALFVDGCFWHSCPKHGTMPSSNVDFWQLKFSRNRARDRFVDAVLCHLGWTVLRVWEHELEQPDRLGRWLSQYLAI
jgi:DNA mismatch endonuclease, patch repair protein